MINPDVQTYIDDQLLKMKAELMVMILKSPGNATIEMKNKKYIFPALESALAIGEYQSIIDGSVLRDTKCYVDSQYQTIKRSSI